jgi:hypothetical protein
LLDVGAISTQLRLRDDGIWYSEDRAATSYPATGHASSLNVEGSSFWFKHRNRCIVDAVKKHPPGKDQAIFDVGGGNGFVSLALAKEGFEIVLVEPGREGALNAKRRGLEAVICATTTSAGFRPRSLPSVGLFDVVEHIEDDLGFLRSLAALMPKGGPLYATVPAYSWLWSAQDEIAGHHRRYDLHGFCRLLYAAGFEVQYATYIFQFLPAAVLLGRTLPYRLGLHDFLRRSAGGSVRRHAVRAGVLGRFVDTLLNREISLLREGRRLPFGGSCLVVARNLT